MTHRRVQDQRDVNEGDGDAYQGGREAPHGGASLVESPFAARLMLGFRRVRVLAARDDLV
jgi:hypothetical protein